MDNDYGKILEDEFYFETQKKNITLSDLSGLGATSALVKGETLLRQRYGDKIFLSKEELAQIDERKKSVTKIDLAEIEKVDQLKAYIDEVSADPNNAGIEYLVAKAAREEEE